MSMLLRNAGLGFVGGVLLWGTGDVVGELTTYYKLRDKALELAEQSEDLKAQVGYPYSPGPWYDAKIGFLGGGSMAQCTFQLQGNKQITDVTIRGLRAKGLQNRALYNLFGPGAWAVIDCTAMFPDSEGFVQPRSLLQHANTSLSHTESGQAQGEGNTAAAHGESLPQHANRSRSHTKSGQVQGEGNTAAAHGERHTAREIGSFRSEVEAEPEKGNSKGSTWGSWLGGWWRRGGGSKQTNVDQGPEAAGR